MEPGWRSKRRTKGSYGTTRKEHELDGGHMVTRSLSEIAETRKRATTVIKAVRADMGVRNKTVFAKASWTSRNPT